MPKGPKDQKRPAYVLDPTNAANPPKKRGPYKQTTRA